MPNEDTTKAADSLICKLCITAYNTVDKKPRCFMPCGHTFCEKCISELLERLCPQCKKPYNQAIVDFDCIDLVKKYQNSKSLAKQPDIYVRTFLQLWIRLVMVPIDLSK